MSRQFVWIPIRRRLNRVRISQTHYWRQHRNVPAPLRFTGSHLEVLNRHPALHLLSQQIRQRCKNTSNKYWPSVTAYVKWDSEMLRTKVLTMCWNIWKTRTICCCDCARISAKSCWPFNERKKRFVEILTRVSKSSCVDCLLIHITRNAYLRLVYSQIQYV